jgi:alpha-ribazole phosphatase
MLEIILVRHGETAWNKKETFRGRADIDLNETGIRQAELLGKYLSAEKIDHIYASPLKRAARTAKAIADWQKIKVKKIDSLLDLDFGEWEGLTLKEAEERDPELYQDWRDTPEQVRLPGGESLQDISSRVKPFLDDAVTRCGEGKIALVTHQVVLKVTICMLLRLGNAGFWNIKIDTGAITRFEFDGNLVILTEHNNTSYLRE